YCLASATIRCCAARRRSSPPRPTTSIARPSYRVIATAAGLSLSVSMRTRCGPATLSSPGEFASATVRGHLLLVGEGPLQAKLERVAFDAGARDRITFLGRVSQEEVLGYYNAT